MILCNKQVWFTINTLSLAACHAFIDMSYLKSYYSTTSFEKCFLLTYPTNTQKFRLLNL